MGLDARHGAGGAIHRCDLPCPAARGLKPEAASVGIAVEHAGKLLRHGTHDLPHPHTTWALIEKQPSLLSLQRLGFQTNTVFETRHLRTRLATHNARLGHEALNVGKAACSDLEGGLRGKHVVDRASDFLAPEGETEGADLKDCGVPEDVDDQARQAVAFAVHTAIGRGLSAGKSERCPQGMGRA